MPDFQAIAPASRNTTRTVTVGLVDISGNTANVTLKELGGSVSDAQVNAFRSAVGNASNAGVYFDSKNLVQKQDERDSRAFTDPKTDVSDLGVFVFDHPSPQVKEVRIEVPAIHIGFINSDGSLNRSEPEVQAVIDTALPMLNDSNPFTGDYYFSHAFYSNRKGSKKINEGNIPNIKDPRGTPDPQP